MLIRRKGGLLCRDVAEEVSHNTAGQRGSRLSGHEDGEEPAGRSGSFVEKRLKIVFVPVSHTSALASGAVQRSEAVSDDVPLGELQAQCGSADATAAAAAEEDDQDAR